MLGPSSTPEETVPTLRSRWRGWALKVARLVVAGLLLGFAYDWAAPRLYRPEPKAGFWLGLVHGGLMPVAAPSLIMGQDVPIFAINHSGRSYKLGYICGINLCGLLFFGMAFARTEGKGASKEPNPAG